MKVTSLIIALLVMCTSAYSQTGEVEIHFLQVDAVHQAGEPDFNSADNEYCRHLVGAKYLDKPITLSYTIERASTYQTGQVEYLGERVPLYPEGLTDRYSFMSDGVGALEKSNIFRVVASFDKALQMASSFVLFNTGQEFNCVMVGVGPVTK